MRPLVTTLGVFSSSLMLLMLWSHSGMKCAEAAYEELRVQRRALAPGNAGARKLEEAQDGYWRASDAARARLAPLALAQVTVGLVGLAAGFSSRKTFGAAPMLFGVFALVGAGASLVAHELRPLPVYLYVSMAAFTVALALLLRRVWSLGRSA